MNNNIQKIIQTIRSCLKQEQDKDYDIAAGIKLFLVHIKAEKSINTFNYYKKHLKVILVYLKTKQITSFNQVTNYVLDDFISFEKIKKIKNITINKRICALKTVSRYLCSINLLSRQIDYSKLKVINKQIKILSSEELIKVLEYTKSLSIRNQIILELFIQTGIRRTELCNIMTSNVDLTNNSIYLEHTKTNSPRYIYFDDNLRVKIISLMRTDCLYLLTTNNKPLSPFTVDSIFERMKKRLSIKVLSPHILRHTFATYILRNGGNLEQVRLLLGHASYQITQRYLHLLQDELKSTSLNFNPMANI